MSAGRCCALRRLVISRPRFPRPALLVWLFPLVMIGVVLGTGNHYLRDVVASVLLPALSIGRAAGRERLARRRRVATVRSAVIDGDGRRLS